MTDEPSDIGGPSDHYAHVTAPPCDECAAEQKRVAFIGMALGVIIGAGAVLIYARTKK